MTRPFPWHDTPRCGRRSDNGVAICGGPVVADPAGQSAHCAACGADFRPTAEEAAQIIRAERAWAIVLEGKVHEDKACARCNGVLPIDRFRLCEPCTAEGNAERQGVLL